MYHTEPFDCFSAFAFCGLQYIQVDTAWHSQSYHLRSYDHNHRQRLADMKKLTASNDAESQKPKQGVELRALESKGPLAGKGFTKIGGAGGLGKGFTKIGGGFKKVGTAVGNEGVKKEEKKEEDVAVSEPAVAQVEVATQEKPAEASKEDDVVMGEYEEEEAITWEEYDFTKPTGCDHATCGGCKTDGIWSGGWVAV